MLAVGIMFLTIALLIAFVLGMLVFIAVTFEHHPGSSGRTKVESLGSIEGNRDRHL